MISQNPQVTLDGSVTISGILSGLPEPSATVIQISGGSLLPGSPVLLPGSKLPLNYAWADRSVVLFADWPDLQAVYEAGLLDVLPANATDEEKAGQPRKWVLNGCGNGLFLPDIGGRFAREWRPNQSDDAGREAGTRQGDAIRNITGNIHTHILADISGAGALKGLTSGKYYKWAGGSYGTSCNCFDFDASHVVPTADENRPLNDAQPVAIYLGRRAQDLQ